MIRTFIATAVVGCLALVLAGPASAQCGMGGGCGGCGGCGSGKAAKGCSEKAADAGKAPKVKESFLSSYFTIGKALGKDELKGIPEARKELASALVAAAKAPPPGPRPSG